MNGKATKSEGKGQDNSKGTNRVLAASKYHMWCRAGMRQKSKTLPSDIVEPGRNLSAGASDSSKDSLMDLAYSTES